MFLFKNSKYRNLFKRLLIHTSNRGKKLIKLTRSVKKLYILKGCSRMKLTKNECTVIKFLLKNARTPDAVIARNLKISLQAVRNIRLKLERNKLIRGYSPIMDHEKLGIGIFAIVLYKITAQAWSEFKEIDIQNWLLHPNVVKFYRIPNGDITHMVHYGFKDIIEMNNFFQTVQSKYSKYVEIVKSYTVGNGNLVKDSNDTLINSNLNPRYEQPRPLELK